MEQVTPILRCNSIEKLTLTTVHEGWRLLVDEGIDEDDPMVFGKVKVDRITVDAHQGGSVTLKLRLGTSDVDAQSLGKLAVNNGQSIWIRLLKPVLAAPAIDGSVGHPALAGERDATDLFAAGAGQDDGPGEGDPDEFSDDEGAAADSGADEQAELEAGMSQALASSGVKPKRGSRAKVLQ